MEKTYTTYVAGTCNIGPAERRRRLLTGWAGLAVTAVLWVLLALFKVAAPWRLFLFLPAVMAAAGFIQGAFHFCAGFGFQGVFNFTDKVGRTDQVEQAESRAKDRRKSVEIFLYSLAVGVAVALAGFFAG